MLSAELQHLDMKSLMGLLYLLEERNVGRAANRLFLSQSAMSRLLQRLRDAFHDPLFIRTSKGMIPTAKATALERPIRVMIENMAGLTSPQRFSPENTDRTFRLQTTHYQAQAYVPFIASQFYQHARHASLETSTVTETSLLHTTDNHADVVLCSEYIQLPGSYERQLLGHEKFGCIMSATHPLAQQSSITLDDYLNYHHILVNIGGSSRIYMNDALAERVRERHFTFRTPYFLAALATVGRTDLLLSSSRLLAERFQEQFNLVIHDLPFEFPDPRYYICWPKAMAEDPGGRWFRHLCGDVVRNNIPYPSSDDKTE
ncbi:HTH-type transcriptional regulator SyrM 1 [Vibrio aerogenes CECT 7868]|uniref:HTH-type transcriptional regulator SyrM 1 n=1 Tax=Vibrio aerogenes CECT 7868 TaxID=1216006 RepID=A0A1M5ZX01_9VIBR|nr:LysR family transcriptional regulator [Vibrio aerogenes]SHI28549.1 HTH-type transcriptional regulator SyrM 1 [Vibrio aerogenes CECT 7868]